MKKMILLAGVLLMFGCDPYVVCEREKSCDMSPKSLCESRNGTVSDHPAGMNAGGMGFGSHAEMTTQALDSCRKKGYQQCTTSACRKR